MSHAGLVLLRHLADKTGRTDGLSRALASPRILVHDRGRVLAGLACAVADGARVISDLRVMSGQRELSGRGASVPAAWRTLAEIARTGTRADRRITAAVNMARTRADRRITAAVNMARRHAWAQVMARPGALPGVRLAGKGAGRRDLHPAGCHRHDRAPGQGTSLGGTSTATACHPLPACCGNAGREPLAWMPRRGPAGSNTAADHLVVRDAAITALPPGFRRRLMLTADGAGASPALVARLDALAGRRGCELACPADRVRGGRERAALRLVPERAWPIAIDARGEVRERRAGGARADLRCAHRAGWIEEAHVAELTSLLRDGPGGDQLDGWPAAMRVFARRARPHPGAQLSLFEAADGRRYSLWVTNRPAATQGWLGQNAYTDAAHRVHARVEDAIRTGQDAGPGHFPSFGLGVTAAWLTAAMTGQILLAWLKLLALDGDLARAEPGTLRYALPFCLSQPATSESGPDVFCDLLWAQID